MTGTDKRDYAAADKPRPHLIYWVERPCPKTDAPDQPCQIREIDHYGIPTGILMCCPHGEVIGQVCRA